MVSSVLLGAALAFAGAVSAACVPRPVTNANTSVTLLFQNNLNLTDDANHVSALLLDAIPQASAAAACGALSESLLNRSTIEAHSSDFLYQLSYQAFRAGKSSQSYAINGGVVTVSEDALSLTFGAQASPNAELPVLCSQSSESNLPGNSVATATNKVRVASNSNTYVGFRNQKSFRFLGIRYAEPPKRFQYTVPYQAKNKVIDATKYGAQCIQTGSGGSEDCLFLNIQTPYLPKAGSKSNLRPVLFWIHGGGFTGGAGSASNSDGGQLASREDIVTVTMNYRLSTLGFLAVPGTNVTGNYGIADQNMALRWTIENIAAFGGDPNQITLNGGSAGACSVRVHLGSPQSIGKFQGAIAMSNLGGGQDLGLSGDYATQYSAYPTIEGSYQLSSALFKQAGCNQTDPNAQVACIKTVNASTLINLPTVSRYVVQDGYWVNTPELVVSHPGPQTAHVPVIFGVARDDGASFANYPHGGVSTEQQALESGLGISAAYADAVVNSSLFPFYNSGNFTLDAFNVTARVSTDIQFRCIDQASAYAGAVTGTFASAYFYQTDRTGFGYDPNGLGGAPPSPGYPLGNPNLPYFRLHGSDQDWAFGYPGVIRNSDDLHSIQEALGYWGSFYRSGQPNPPDSYLRARGYVEILNATKATGPWEAIKDESGPIRLIDWPSTSAPFVDVPQCKWLNYSIEYYLDGGH